MATPYVTNETAVRTSSTVVRHFRQIVLWPLALAPVRGGTQIQEHWAYLSELGEDQPWRECRDEFSCEPEEFKERHYSEFVTFLPYVRRFLYGEEKARARATVGESPIHVLRRNDVARVRMTFPHPENP